MAPNSHVINWLRSVYRRVLRRQWVTDARRAVAANAFERRPVDRMESLETRVMLSSTNRFDLPKANYVANPTVTPDITSAFTTGLNAVAAKLDALSQAGEFKTDVPGLLEYDQDIFNLDPPKAKNLADILGTVNGATLSGLIQSEISGKVSAVTNGSLLSSLNFSASGSIGLLNPIHFTVTTSDAKLVHLSGDQYEVTFKVGLTVTDGNSDHLFFDLGRNADQFGLRPTVPNAYFPSFSGEIGLDAGLAVDFTTGVKVTITEGDFDGQADAPDTKIDVVNNQNDFFIEDAVLAATAKVDTTGDAPHVATAMQFGFLDVDLTVDTFKLDGRINLSLNNGAEIAFGNIGSITTSATTTGTIDAAVSLKVDNVSGTTFSGGFGTPAGGYVIKFHGAPLGAAVSSIGASSDPRTAPQIELNSNADSVIRPFKNVEPGAIVGLLKSFIDRLGSLPASSVLSLPLPLTKGKTLGQILPLGNIASNALIFDGLNAATGNKLVDSKGNPQFTSAQTLATRLAAILGASNVDIKPTFVDQENGSEARKLMFTVGFDAKFDPAVLTALQSSDIGFDVNLGKIAGLESTAKVKLTPSGHLGFTFGIDLAAGGSQPIVISPPLVDAQIRAVLNASGGVPTPSNGRLSSTAAFKLTIGGSLGGSVNVVLTAADTATNNNIDDLVADLQAKINAAIDAVPTLHSQPDPGKLLVKVGKLSDGRLTLSSPYTTFLSLKRLTPDDGGGFAGQLGFVDGQQASAAPTPVNGRLGDDADFKLRIGTDATIHNVKVTKASTLNNATVDDLVLDIRAALVTAGIDTKVDVQRISGSTNGIMLVVKGTTDRMLQVVDADDVVERDLGWQDRQISAEIATVGANELVVQGNAMAPSNGKPGGDVTFQIKIDGGAPVTVTVKANSDANNPSNTSDNTSIADLVADINLAIAVAKLPDGRSLGSILAAGAIDTDHDAASSADGDSFNPDTIVFRSTATIGSFEFVAGANSSAIGFTSNQVARHVGPDTATGQVPASGATFKVSLGDQAPVTISVTQAAAGDNAAAADRIAALVADLQAAIDATALAGKVVVGRAGNRIVLAAPNVANQRLRINLDETAAAGTAARDTLGLRDGLLDRADEGVRFFIQDAGIDLKAKVDVDSMAASAHLGFIGISIANTSNAHLSLDLKIQLKDNQNNTSRIFLDQLDERLTDLRFVGTAKLPTSGKLTTGPVTFDVTIDGVTRTVTVPISDPDGTGPRTGTDTNNTPADLVRDVQDALDAALTGINARVVASLSNGGALVLSVSALQAKSFAIANVSTEAANGLKLAAGTKSSFLVVPTATWGGSAAFKGINVPSPIPGIDTLPGLPFDISVNVGNGLPGLAKLTPDLSFVPQDLLNFSDLLFTDPLGHGVLDAIAGLSDFLSAKFGSLPFVGTKLPILNVSLADLLNVGETFKDVLAGFSSNPTATVQDLRNRLIEALGLPTSDPDGLVKVSYDKDTNVLLLDVTFKKAFNRTLPIDFDLKDFAPSVPFNLKGNAGLEVDGSASARLAVGIDLTTPTAPDLFVDTGKTSFDVKFAARGKGLNFVGSLGPAGLFISDGQLALDADGNVATTNDPVHFGIHLDDNDTGSNPNDNRLSFANINQVIVTSDPFVGKVNAKLPIFFPTDSNFLGNLGLQINDLRQFLGGNTSSVQVQVPDLSNIYSNLNFNILDNLPLLIDGLDFVFGQLQGLLDKKLGSLNLPLIGDGLHDAAQFINNLRTNVFEGLKAKLANATQNSVQIITDGLNQIFGPTGLNILKSPITPTNSLHGQADDFAQWSFKLGQSVSVPVPFDLGLPVLGLKSDGAMTIDLGWNLNLGFGLDFDRGFYFLVNDGANTPEMTVDAAVNLPPSITGNLLFLKVTAEDKHAGPDLDTHFVLDLSGAGSDGKMSVGELGNLSAAVNLTGNANVNLKLKAGINAGASIGSKAVAALPTIVTDFKLNAAMDLANATGDSPFTLSYVAFENVGLDLGSFFSDFLRPLVSGIQDVTKPLQPFIDVFTSPIPVISDLAGEPVTLLDVAALFGEVDPGMIEAIANVITLVNTIPTNAGNVVVPFGSVVLVGGSSDFNLFDPKAMDKVRDSKTPLSSLGNFGSAINNFNNSGGFDAALDSQSPSSEVSSFTKGLSGKSFGDFIDFPFLKDPSQILGALFGRPFTIVTLDLPPFEFGFTYSQFFPIIGPLGASITGSLGAKFDFAFGYDSFGLQKFAEGGFKYPLDLFRGFYISDTTNPDGTGSDVNEIEITGSLVGSAELNLGVAKGSVGGGVKVTFGLDLNDPNTDGKVRIEELINNIRFSDPPFNPLGIFDVNIKVEAFLTWAIEVLFVFKASGQIGPSLPLLDVHIPLPHQPVLATEVGADPDNASLKVLRLNMGAFAGDRLNENVTDGSEEFIVTQVGANKFDVTAFGVTQTYEGIGRIEALGGQGDDKIKFDGVTVPILVEGGAGDDLIDLATSSGAGTIKAGSGNDTVKGGSGKDTVDGGDGADLILGGANDDSINGGGGNDTVSGDDGNDVISGDADADQLAGGGGNDFIDGAAGDDQIWGDATFNASGAFVAATVAGDDILTGGTDKDTVHGDGGNDRIGGGGAADVIEGGLGADTIYGDSTYDKAGTLTGPLPMTEGGDRIYGESEAAPLTGAGSDGGDLIHGEAGNDFVRGNTGNDSVFGDAGADILFGDQGNDTVEGGTGSDTAFGGAGADRVLGQADSDVLFGDDGLVVYYNYPTFTGYVGDQMSGANRLIGDGDAGLVGQGAADADELSRDLIITDVRDTDGDDYVDGAAGNDVAFGGKGNDHVFGDADPAAAGFDTATAASGDDLLFGDGGKVRFSSRVRTVAATVTPDKGGNDTVIGNGGSDVEFGGAGNDLMQGGHGVGKATSGPDADILIGDNGEVDFTAGKRTKVFTTNEGVGGADTINGNEDNDIALGGAAGDTVNGNAGDDVLIGDEGRVEFTADAAFVTLIKTTDTDEAKGGVDDVNGNTGKDVILGGVQGDNLNGNEDRDIVLGDEGQLLYNLAGPGFDGAANTLDKVETTSFTLGGDDKITGADDNDIALGGSKADNIKGDAPLDDPGDDTLIGDQGEVDFFNGLVTRVITTDTADVDGGVDTVNGNEGKDVILGGVAGDVLNGNDGTDILLGDEGQLQYNLTGPGRDGDPLTVDNIETLQPTLGGSDVIQGNAGADIAFGGAAGDRIFGDADSPATGQDGADMLFGDGGRASLRNNVVWKLESTDTAEGGSDTMEGNAGGDIMLGGAKGDQMHGDAADDGSLNATLDGNDIMLGDNGLLNWLYAGDAALAGTIEAGFNFAVTGPDITKLDVISTTAPNDGGKDLLFGNAGGDVMLGGTDADLLVGDNTMGAPGAEAFGSASSSPGSDLEFGDHGRLYPQHSFLAGFPSRNFFSIDTTYTSGGAGDRIFGNEADDVQVGGQGDDQMFGNAGDDDMVGGHNVEGGVDEFEKPTGKTVNDFMDGGAGDDAMAGDNAVIWRNGSALQANDLRLRFRTLAGSLLYVGGQPNITVGGHNDPLVSTTRTVVLLDHSKSIQDADTTGNAGSRYGNDVMAGNADDDAIFGQLGDDMIQGDGRIDDHNLDILVFEGVKPNGTVTDGNDYVEGNGGDDLLIGNLGQDDIIGGSSKFFGLTDAEHRPDGGDIIFGGASTPDRVKRHAFTGDVTGDATAFGGANLVRRHATDSDFIMGDNADVYRIVTDAGPSGVGGATAFVQFNYDKTSAYENRGDLRIVVRAYDVLDYKYDEADTSSIGDRDVVHGESGDDFIHGMTGSDILYGDAENDEIFGERDKDWLSGGTGDDAMLGDNGFVLTSRNAVAEPLYGVAATTQAFVATPGNFLQALMNPNGRLKHAVDLEPFDQGADDVMYGGLGSDDMHGGEGNDGMSGAEALPEFYNAPEASPRVEVGDIAGDKSTEIRIIPRDGNGAVNQNFYDYVNALPKLAKHFLNFENDASLKTTIGSHFDPNNGDGRDNLFGDWGNDWLVGGSGRDNLFGGMGNDLLNLDDNLETDGGLNDQPDNGNLIPGEAGGPVQVYDNADTAYGGGGRDVLILNTGADRAEDWVGEYNAFIAPFAPFGNGQVERNVPPSKFEFFYLLGESTGADQTRVGNLTVNGLPVFADPARRGEPFGELGLVTQQDKTAPFDWASQNGAPIDNQAGNTPGGKRDTRGDGLSGGTTNTTAVSTATPVVDLPLADVVDLSFTYWAEELSPGLPTETLLWLFSPDTVFAGESLIQGLKLQTSLLSGEYSWILVPA